MLSQKYGSLFENIYPGFFHRESIRTLPKEYIHDEMILPLSEFDPHQYEKELDESVTFGFYTGDTETIREKVAQVEKGWLSIYARPQRIYCGYVNGQIASFCIIENMGEHLLNGKNVKVGGPGCVGTVPEYRRRGIGLTMVKHVTQILKDEGFDYSYIHYTGVAPWYELLGYQTFVRWNCDGILKHE